MAILGRRTRTQFFTVGHIGQITNPNRHAITTGDDDLLDGGNVRDLGRYTHQELLAVTFDVAGAHVLVVGLQGRDHIFKGQIQRAQLGRIGRDVNLTLEPAHGVDFGHTRNVAQLRTNHPILQRTQIGGGVRRAIGFAGFGIGIDGVGEDLAHAGGNRTQGGFDTFGHLRFHLRHALGDLLPGKVDVRAVLEHDGDLGQPVAGDRAEVLHLRQTGHGRLDGERDALLGLQWRVTGRFGVDLNLDVGDVGGDIDRDLTGTPDADGDQGHRQRHDQPAMINRDFYDFFEHDGLLSARVSRRTFRCPP